jgi:predicted dinucleotide-binding enzyme
MNIAIIGAGNVGRALASSTVRAGHTVTISANDPSHAEAVAAETGARAVRSNSECIAPAEIVILAVPVTAASDLGEELGDALAGKVVVDVTNRPTPDPEGGRSTSAAEEIQALLPNARVVKAFNTAFASRQADPVVDGQPADAYVAGDDPEAKKKVLALARSIGFRPFDVGPLAQARTLEGMAWIHISLNMQNAWPWQSAWKIVGPTGDDGSSAGERDATAVEARVPAGAAAGQGDR